MKIFLKVVKGILVIGVLFFLGYVVFTAVGVA